MSARTRRAVGLTTLVGKDVKYDEFLPLHQLWQGYVAELIGTVPTNAGAMTQLELKLAKADLHGAILCVTQSRTPSCVGLQGIMIRETRDTFVIVTKKNKVKHIPKEPSIFSVQLSNVCSVTLYGKNFCVRPFDRVGKLFKRRGSTDL
jgi:ribonuclease P protein subunit POP4